MKTIKTRGFAILLCLILLCGMLPVGMPAASAAPTYNVGAAVDFARAHWHDGIGLCAEFVSRCLSAGGIAVPDSYTYYNYTDQRYENMGPLYALVNPYVAAPALLRWFSEQGYTIIKYPSHADMELGDVVFMKNSHGEPDGHACIITGFSGSMPLYCAHNRDRLDAPIYSQAVYLVKMSLPVSIAPHTCDKGAYAGIEEGHPHRDCYRCSICREIWAEDGTSRYIESCLECHRPEKPVITALSVDCSAKDNVQISWTTGANTTHSDYWIFYQEGNAWKFLRRITYATSPVTDTVGIGTYKVLIAAANSDYREADGSSWLWSEGDDAYFTVEHAYEASVIPPTCTAQGYTAHICSCCDDAYADSYVNALGHSWDGGNITAEPTEDADGVMTFACTRCGETKTEKIPKLDHPHSYTDTVTEATCTAQGYTTHTCSQCGVSYVDSYTAALGHSWQIPIYVWNDDNSKVTGSRVCMHDGSHVETESADTVCEVTKEATYDEEGEITYTAVFENEAFDTQIKTVATPKLTLPCNDGDPCPGNVFADMPAKDNWAHDAIDWAIVNKITTGTGATAFSPDGACTRAQIVTFLWRAAGKPEPTDANTPFTDVQEGSYYSKAVLWAVEQGVTTGTSADRFSPDSTCTRAQIVTFLWRAEGEPQPSTGINPFADLADGYYYDAVLWAVEQGVTTGTSGTRFSPHSACSRAQIVTFLYRAMAQ